MRGVLFDEFIVQLHPWTNTYMGSWVPGSGDPLQAYGQETLRQFFHHVKTFPAPVVLDIGANLGSFCLLAAFHPAMRVYAFEPVPELYRILCANIEANSLQDRVVAVCVALSDHVGTGTMRVPLNTEQSGLSFLDTREPDMPCYSLEVAVSTVDAFCAERWISRLDAIKLDVEGLETQVLQGARRMLRRCHPYILSENTWSERQLSVLTPLGYQCIVGPSDIEAVYPQGESHGS